MRTPYKRAIPKTELFNRILPSFQITYLPMQCNILKLIFLYIRWSCCSLKTCNLFTGTADTSVLYWLTIQKSQTLPPYHQCIIRALSNRSQKITREEKVHSERISHSLLNYSYGVKVYPSYWIEKSMSTCVTVNPIEMGQRKQSDLEFMKTLNVFSHKGPSRNDLVYIFGEGRGSAKIWRATCDVRCAGRDRSGLFSKPPKICHFWRAPNLLKCPQVGTLPNTRAQRRKIVLEI